MVLDVPDPVSAPDAEPVLDEDGLLRFRGGWVAVSRKEERLLRPLLLRRDRVVSRDQLTAEVWPDAAVADSSLNTLAQRLRRRIEPLGLTIESVRSRGFMLSVLAVATTSTPYVAEKLGDLSEGLSWLIS